MIIFITGASGFIGGAAAAYFSRQGHTVLGMSRSAATDEKIRQQGATPVRCNLDTVAPADIAGCEVVLHAAAFLGQWARYEAFYHSNVAGTERLLRIARAASVRKFVYISTESVLATGRNLLNADESLPYPDTPFHYSKTKQLAEIAVRQASETGHFETVSLRPRMVWGPGDRVLLPLLKEAVAKQKFSWIGSGRYSISTTHIYNLLLAIDLAIAKAPGGSVYFVADAEVGTIRSFITRLLQTQGITVPRKSIPAWVARAAAYGVEKIWNLLRFRSRPPITRLGAALFSSHCTLSTQKIRSELGYEPVISVEAGMQELRGKAEAISAR